MTKGPEETLAFLLSASWKSGGRVRDLTHLCLRQTTAPNSLPTTAVTAIATAPQNVTRSTPRQTEAPPALAPTAPSSARKASDSPVTQSVIVASGTSAAVAKGSAAPTAKVSADAPAATKGLASVCSEIPN